MLPGGCCPCGHMSIPYKHPWVRPSAQGSQPERTWPWTSGGSSLCGSSSILATQAHLSCANSPHPTEEAQAPSPATMHLQNLVTPPKKPKPQIDSRLPPSAPLPPALSVAVVTLNLCFAFFPSSRSHLHPTYSCSPAYFSLWVGEFTCDSCLSFSLSRCCSKERLLLRRGR